MSRVRIGFITGIILSAGLLTPLVVAFTYTDDILKMGTIFGEATANVDPENEKELTEAIEELTREKTIIMIAHRLKTVRHADRIFVVDKGRIAQAGTHDELMKEDGIYRRFVECRREAVSWKIGSKA